MSENMVSHKTLSTTAAPEKHNIHHHQENSGFSGKRNSSTQGAIRSDVNMPRNASTSYAKPKDRLSINRQPPVGIQPPKDYCSVSIPELPNELRKKEQDPPPQPQASSTDHGVFYQFPSKYAPLFMAALKGDWKAAEKFFENHPEAICETITETMETVLHIAAGTEHTKFVEKLVMRLDIDQLRKRNRQGHTAIYRAAISGVTNIAKAIINRDKELRITKLGGENDIDVRFLCKELDSSLLTATTRGHKDMVRFLYHVTKESCRAYNIDKIEESWVEVDYQKLFIVALTSGLYDFAWELLQHHSDIATRQLELLQDLDMEELFQHLDDIVDEDQPDGVKAGSLRRMNDTTAFQVLARKPKAFYSGSRLNTIQLLVYQCLPVNVNKSFLTPAKQSFGEKLFRGLLYLAAKFGIVEFLVVVIRLNPDFLWKVNEDGHTIFHIAVKHRRKYIFHLIDQFGATAMKDSILVLTDIEGNNMLHLAAKFPPPNRLKTDSGAALQLREELMWFLDIDTYRDIKNHKGETPESILSKQSKELVKEGEKWMKTTCTSCMVVSTVSFAALFTVPGGDNNDKNSMPAFRKEIFVKLFLISDSLSLVSSIYSILKFLWILIPRHAVEDFLQAVPNMVARGLIALFISVANLMVAFGTALFIAIGEDLIWVAITIAVVSSLIVASFVNEQFFFIANIVSSSFKTPKFFQRHTHMF